MTFELDRRTLFRGGAAAGLATLAVAGFEESVTAATLQGSLPSHVDVVVVGGGLSGLVAARKVAAKGRSVLVVEARDRVGGRLLNHTLKGGAVIEAGGAFVGPTQDHIKALAAEMGVHTFKEYVQGKNVYISAQGKKQLYTGTVPPDPLVLLDAALLLKQLDKFASEINVDAPWTHPKAAEWDSMTLGDYIRKNAVNKAGILNLIAAWTQPGFGADPDQLSLLFVIHYIACSGNEATKGTFELNANTTGGAQESRFIGGSQLVPLKVAQRLGTRVALDAAVHRIDQGSTKAIVKTSRGNVTCKQVIVACPPPLVLDIDWYPQLPAQRHALLTHMKMGRLMKCDAVYSTPFWRADGLSGSGVADSGATRTVFDNSPNDASVGVLLSFVGGATWQKYGTLPQAERKKAVLEGFAQMFGPKALKPIEYTEHNWPHETWTRGAPVAVMAPGTMTAFGPAIRRPFGRVHWAGTETSTYWTGYMDGACRAGERAAAEVLAKL
ncbi:flavin monoamine oxidase family protein [Nocardioides marmorisolisilvae]|uniref:FAD-dependent oxidoreductase n=1 Tax=Nocardioides marmorisolisilvae TaxID=1542737 RepID=A0A3N0DRK9_9ACTN|nr:FAD-dependent oxidoreductase [Nocardioides marmorisolisilvae]RNL78269.1 FAD-dependent oxidoreductase [Nocardioides marmorisolisilvae]